RFHIALAGGTIINTFAQLFFDVHPRSTTKDHQIQQRVTAQTIGAVNRYTGNFTTSIETRDDFVVAVGVLSESLTVDVGDDTAHHVVTGGNHWNRLFYRIRVSEGTRQLKNARQFLIQGLFAQVVKLEEYVIAFGTAAAPLKNFQDHGTGDHIATGQIFGVGCIALH